jgi:hypothetical protein
LVWGNDSILSTVEETLPNPARGGFFLVAQFAHFGGLWTSVATSGSRHVSAGTATGSFASRGGRGVCQHLILD